MESSACASASDEWQALVLLASPGLTPAYQQQLVFLLKRDMDFARLRMLLVQHRVLLAAAANVTPAVQSGLPEAFAEWLASRRAAMRQQVQRQFQTQARMGSAFTRAGVEHRFIKGLALTSLLHSDFTLRQAKDIDVMIMPAQLDAANACLQALGYSSLLDEDSAALTGNSLALALGKDVLYRAKGLPEVELHWRVDNAETRFSTFYSRRLFELPEKVATAEEFVYLCWHAGKTLHHRLKWLVDIDCYLRLGERQDPGFCERALLIAREQGVERHVLLALFLLARTFPWQAQRGCCHQLPCRLEAVGRRIEQRWLLEESGARGKLMMMCDRFYLPRFWRDRYAMAKSLLLLPTDDVRDMLNRRSGLNAGLAKVLVPLLTIRGYWRR